LPDAAASGSDASKSQQVRIASSHAWIADFWFCFEQSVSFAAGIASYPATPVSRPVSPTGLDVNAISLVRGWHSLLCFQLDTAALFQDKWLESSVNVFRETQAAIVR
jgi:hypothetical protein